jgi:hypothetical protein
VKRAALVPLSGLVAVAAFCVWRAIDVSGDPGRYYRYRSSHDGFVYPTASVVVWCAIIACELALVGWLVARSRRLPRACGLFALALGLVFFATVIFGMHAPPYFTSFVIAQLFAGAWMLLSALITAIIESAVDVTRKADP